MEDFAVEEGAEAVSEKDKEEAAGRLLLDGTEGLVATLALHLDGSEGVVEEGTEVVEGVVEEGAEVVAEEEKDDAEAVAEKDKGKAAAECSLQRFEKSSGSPQSIRQLTHANFPHILATSPWIYIPVSFVLYLQ